MDLTVRAASRVEATAPELKTTSCVEVGMASVAQLAASAHDAPLPPPSQVTAVPQLVLAPPSVQLVQLPEWTDALLLASEARLAVRVPVTAKVQAEASRFTSDAADVPVMEAAPATVMVRPPRFANDVEFPLVTVKFP